MSTARAAITIALTFAACAATSVREVYPGRYCGASDSGSDLHEELLDRCPYGYDALGSSSQTVDVGPIDTQWQEKRDVGPNKDLFTTTWDPGPSTVTTVEVVCRASMMDEREPMKRVAAYLAKGGTSCEAFGAFLHACRQSASAPGCEDASSTCRRLRKSGCTTSSELAPLRREQVEPLCPQRFAPVSEQQLVGNWSGEGGGLVYDLRADGSVSRILTTAPGEQTIMKGLWAYSPSLEGNGKITLSLVENGRPRAPLTLEVLDADARVPRLRDNDGHIYRATWLANPRP